MFDTDNIFNLLASGHSAEDIAALFTSSLNDAEARLRAAEEERKAREAEAAARREKERQAEKSKHDDAKELVRTFFNFLDTHYGDALGEPMDLSDEELDPIAGLLVMIMDLEVMRVQAKPVEKKVRGENANEVFADFFKAFGLN
jgi:ketosteroid isomerase-like protein